MTFRGFCQKSRWLWHCSCAFSVSVLLFPLPPVFQFFSCLLPVFPLQFPFSFVDFGLLSVWKETLAGLQLLSPLGVYYLDSWWLSTRMSHVGNVSWCSSPCTCGGRNRAGYPFFCSLMWDTGYKINSAFKSGFVGNVQQKYLFSFVILGLFCFWRPSQNCVWAVCSGQ